MKISGIISKCSLVAVVLVGSIVGAQAGPKHPKAAVATPRVAKKQTNQAARIGEGVKSGELTKDEVKDLKGDQAELRQDKKEAKSDGVVTPAERRALRQESRQNSRTIYKEKHDEEVRPTK